MTQRVFITGGASGLGRAIALRYAKEGAKVCIGDINPEQGIAVEQEINNAGGEGYFVECDVRRLPDLEKIGDDLTGNSGGMYRDMLDQEVAKSISAAGGLGLADMMIEQFQRQAGMSGARAALPL